MLNKHLEDELRKVTRVRIEFDDNTTEIRIPKVTVCVPVKVKQNHYYILQLKDQALHPSDNSVVSTNWNRGVIPQEEFVKAEVDKVVGKMIHINSVGYDFNNDIDLNYMWSGWLDDGTYSIIEELM